MEIEKLNKIGFDSYRIWVHEMEYYTCFSCTRLEPALK